MDKNQIFGGNPLAVAIRLAVLSIIVGIVMSALNIQPQNILQHIRLFLQRISDLGFGVVEGTLGYLVLGAVVVVPIWLLTRVFGVFGKGRGDRHP